MAAVLATRGEIEAAAPDVTTLPGYLTEPVNPPWYCALHYLVGGLLIGLAGPTFAAHLLKLI